MTRKVSPVSALFWGIACLDPGPWSLPGARSAHTHTYPQTHTCAHAQPQAFENAITLVMATGGSTNAVRGLGLALGG